MKKVLIIDDELAIRNLLSAAIEYYADVPCAIFLAENGAEAIKLAQQEKPDLVLLDVVMFNGPDGLVVCKYLKTDPTTRHAYVIMMSGYSQRRYFEEAFAVGADDYFCKPFELPSLQTKISTILNQEKFPTSQKG